MSQDKKQTRINPAHIKKSKEFIINIFQTIFSRIARDKNPLETILGGLVIFIALLFVGFAYSTADLHPVSGYTIKANFFKAGGIDNGSDVRISGIKVGNVIDQYLDEQDYSAIIEMSIKNDIKIPKDTQAMIVGDGILGGKYVKLIPGTSKEIFQDGEILYKTKDFQSLEDSVGEIIFLATSKDEEKEE